MNAKLKSLLQQLLLSPRRFPVEMALGLSFFAIAAWYSETRFVADNLLNGWLNADILWLFVPLVSLSFWLRRVNRWAYYASFFLFIPLMALNLKPFLWTYGFGFTYVLAAILLIVGNRRMDNTPFAAHALHVVNQMFVGLLLAGVLMLAVIAIVASFLYIFGINEPRHIYEHIFQFIWFVLAPQFCCTLIWQNEYGVNEPDKALRLILNYILSPAIVIYTVILYTYFIKIALEWDLPKGGVAWLVMGFITVALVGRVAQSILSKRHFDWFYRHFTLIAIPPLIMYWIGSIYRIRLYSFTESRFYLMVAGVLMTLFVIMLYKERTRRFQTMAIIFGAAIVLFTYIPGISAKSIGLRCQKQRLTEITGSLNLIDPGTGKLNNAIDLKSIRQDSLLCEQYKDANSVIGYVREAMGRKAFKQQYGDWTHSEYDFNYILSSKDVGVEDCHSRTQPVEVGPYTILLPSNDYECDYDQHTITVSRKDDAIVLEYPIRDIMRRDSALQRHPERLLTYRNDSLLLVLEDICLDDTVITSVNLKEFQLFKKQPHP